MLKSDHPRGYPIRYSYCSGIIFEAPNAFTYLWQLGHFCIDGAVKFAFVVGVDFIELDAGVGNYSTVIVLMDGGELCNVPFDLAKFKE